MRARGDARPADRDGIQPRLRRRRQRGLPRRRRRARPDPQPRLRDGSRLRGGAARAPASRIPRSAWPPRCCAIPTARRSSSRAATCACQARCSASRASAAASTRAAAAARSPRRRYEDLWSGGPPREPVAVFCPAAACVLAARRDLAPAPFDERFPLFFNDGDLCARLARLGRRAEIVPAATAQHGYGTSVARAQHADPARMRAEWVASMRRYAGRWWPRAGARGAARLAARRRRRRRGAVPRPPRGSARGARHARRARAAGRPAAAC